MLLAGQKKTKKTVREGGVSSPFCVKFRRTGTPLHLLCVFAAWRENPAVGIIIPISISPFAQGYGGQVDLESSRSIIPGRAVVLNRRSPNAPNQPNQIRKREHPTNSPPAAGDRRPPK